MQLLSTRVIALAAAYGSHVVHLQLTDGVSSYAPAKVRGFEVGKTSVFSRVYSDPPQE
jgi:hypothetical protein